ncbi:hypothetical protein JCM14469_00820 [Desulfatiferula olefinivorans]
MRIPLISKNKRTPLDQIEDHTKKIKECTWAFQQALECFQNHRCESFEDFRQDVIRLAKEAHAQEGRIRSGVPGKPRTSMQAYLWLRLLKDQSRIVESLEAALEWMSFQKGFRVPDALEKDFFLLFDSVIDPIEELVKLIPGVRKHFKKPSAKHRSQVLKALEGISSMDQETRRLEERLKRKIFSTTDNPITLFHLIRLTEILASISSRADDSADLIRALLAA